MTERTEADPSSGQTYGATRREALRLGVAVGAAGLGLARRCDAASDSDDDALDEALERIHASEPLVPQGLSTHAPMVAEALCALGRADRAVAWVESYDAPSIEIPQASKRIDRADWRAALGARSDAASWEAAVARFGDWKELFLEDLAEAPWQQVLDAWAARLAPGICAAATHGVIRTAHAARGLARRQTPVRIGELARGLAYWAASYQELPARTGGGERVTSYAEALEKVPMFWEECASVPGGNIVNGLRMAGRIEGFAGVRDLVNHPDDVAAALSAISAIFARVYLRHGTQHHAIAFVHAVTGPCALRRLLPHLEPETARAALPYAWQAAAGIYCAYARKSDAGEGRETDLAPADLVARALENGDDHVIKFIEVLLAEHALVPDSVYLAVARDAVERL